MTHVVLPVLLFFFFGPGDMSCRILVPQPGIKPGPTQWKCLNSKHWTSREFPLLLYSWQVGVHLDPPEYFTTFWGSLVQICPAEMIRSFYVLPISSTGSGH